MDKFLETHNLPKLNHEEIASLNRLIISQKIELVIKNVLAKKKPVPGVFTGKFYQTFKEGLT